MIDVLTRDAILNAKRNKPRHHRANKTPPVTSRLKNTYPSPALSHTRSPTPALLPPDPIDIDSPIPIRPYPFAEAGAGTGEVSHPDAARQGRSGRHNAGANPNSPSTHQASSHTGTPTSEMRIGSLPAAIRGLHTSPDNPPRFRCVCVYIYRHHSTPSVTCITVLLFLTLNVCFVHIHGLS